jgi:hypothetical protein
MSLWDLTGEVSGAGSMTLTHSGIVMAVWAAVTDPGPGGQVDFIAAGRYAKLGYWTLLNVVSAHPFVDVDGDYHHDLHWLAFLTQKWIMQNPNGFDPTGDDALHYFLFPGVKAKFYVQQV